MRWRFVACLSIVTALAAPVAAETAHLGTQPAPLVAIAQASRELLVERAGGPRQVLSTERIIQLVSFTQRAGLGRGANPLGNEWTGPLLWDVLVAAGAVDPSRPRDQARLAVRITGADGYASLVAVGEISPQFANRPIQLAHHMNGESLPDQGLRLIVPDDALGGRSVRDVVRLSVE
jgi:Oxidoreductase molybdopterin binding domain